MNLISTKLKYLGQYGVYARVTESMKFITDAIIQMGGDPFSQREY